MKNKNLSKTLLMFTELIGGVFLVLVGIQGYLFTVTLNAVTVFAGILLFLHGLGLSDELDRENRIKPPMGPGGNVPPVSNPPHKEIHPNILCGSGDDDEENKEEEN